MQYTNLKDTVDLMLSNDYKDRFFAEYLQLKIRHDKLAYIIEMYETRSLDFEPSCSPAFLKYQLSWMQGYMLALRTRAEIEKIDLE